MFVRNDYHESINNVDLYYSRGEQQSTSSRRVATHRGWTENRRMTQCFRKDTKLNAVLLSDVQSQKQLEPNTVQVTREISTRQNCASCHEAHNYHTSQHPVKETPQNSQDRKILCTLHLDPPGSQTLASPTNTTRGCDHRQHIIETAARYVPQLM